MAVVDYFDGSARGFLRDVVSADRLLCRANIVFQRFGQEHWCGRSEATSVADIDLRKGRVDRARLAFERIAADAQTEGLPQRVCTAKLRAAECLGRLGRQEEMLATVRDLRIAHKKFAVVYDKGVRELFARVDKAEITSEMVAHVVEYLEARDRGVQKGYRPFKLVKGGSRA